MIHVKLRDWRDPCRDYVGILIFFVKNYVIHVKLRDSRKTAWFIKNSLMTFSLKEIAPIFGYIFYSRNLYYRHSWETRPKLRNHHYYGSNVVCFICRFNSFSPGQKAILVGDNSGIHERLMFPPLSKQSTILKCASCMQSLQDIRVVLPWAGANRFHPTAGVVCP